MSWGKWIWAEEGMETSYEVWVSKALEFIDLAASTWLAQDLLGQGLESMFMFVMIWPEAPCHSQLVAVING